MLLLYHRRQHNVHSVVVGRSCRSSLAPSSLDSVTPARRFVPILGLTLFAIALGGMLALGLPCGSRHCLSPRSARCQVP
jgi:hypothetical protein